MRTFFAALTITMAAALPAQAEIIDLTPTPDSTAPVELFSDIQYSHLDNGFGRNELYLDLLKPASAEPTPVIVFVMGSGWRGIERERLIPQLVPLAEAGFAVATIDYRGIGEASFPEPQKDVKAAVRFLRTNADQYNIDPDAIGLFGNSAGGHLVTIAGLTGDDEMFVDTRWSGVSSNVQAVATFYPALYFESGGETPYDLASMHLAAWVSDEANAEFIASATPETYISDATPPVLLIHGTADPIVPVAQSERFYEALDAASVDTTFLRVDGIGHSFEDMTRIPEVNETVIAFFERTLKDR